MIKTPEYAVNPKGFRRAESIEAGDGIPIENASGFGGYADRDCFVGSLICSYTEINTTTTIDVSQRFCDVYLRATGASIPTITISGALPPGRRLIVDSRALTNRCYLVIGGVTYTLYKNEGVMEFISTSIGWDRPSNTFYRLRATAYLSVEGPANISETLNVTGNINGLANGVFNNDLTAHGRFYMRTDPVTLSGSLGPGGIVTLGKGFYVVSLGPNLALSVVGAGLIATGAVYAPDSFSVRIASSLSSGSSAWSALRF